MRTLLILAVVIAVATAYYQPDDKCLACICKHESYCRPLECRQDVGSLSCGYYQMKDGYYTDAKQWSGWKKDAYPLTKGWKSCSQDKTCAKNAVYNYMQRYARKSCSGSGTPDCETFSRIHNGGPNGCNNPNTVKYWAVIKKCYEA